MYDAPVAAAADLKIEFPESGVIRVVSASLFAEPDDDACRHFLCRALLAPEIDHVVIAPAAVPAIELRYDGERHGLKNVLERVADLVRGSKGAAAREALVVAPASTARDRHGVIRYRRYASRVTGWRVERERIGSLRLTNPVLYRKGVLCDAIDRELMSVLGVLRFNSSSTKCQVEIEYDPRQLSAAQLLEILDGALASTDHPERLDKLDRELTVSTISVPFAAFAQFAAPALLPVAGGLFLYTTLPSFKNAWRVTTKEHRLGVDALDSIVVLACFGSMHIFAGSILAWCLSYGRFLVRRTEDDSKKLLLGAFGKQPRFCWLLQDGQEIQVALDKLQKGDIVIVHTGEVVPVDGIITDGLAMIDQHALTGESTPAEKEIGRAHV